MVIPLSCLKTGQSALVVWTAGPPLKERRMALWGLQKGARVLCVMEGHGGLGAYWAAGAVLGIRSSDAREVFVRVRE